MESTSNRIVVTANAFYVAEVNITCWRCRSQTPAYGFLMPDRQAMADQSVLGPHDHMGFPFYIHDLDPHVVHQMATIAPTFTLSGRKGENQYWRNHCTHCGMPQGDFYLYEEANTAFSPLVLDPRRRPSLRLRAMPSRFRGECGSFMPAGHLRNHLALLLMD